MLAAAAAATVAAVALTVVGCDDGPRHCVDSQNHLEPDAVCEAHGGGHGGGGYFYVRGGSSGWHNGDLVIGSHADGGFHFGGFGHGGGEGGGE